MYKRQAHVHFREPGFSYKETIKSGSLAAAKGGYTAVCTMPNLDPAPDCKKHLDAQLDILTGLGNGYDLTVKTEKPVLIGGGVGVPPLYKLSKELKNQGKRVSVILGFNSEKEIFFEEEFKEIADRVLICTADGSYGIKGFVTDAVKDIDFDYFFTCGPEPMFKALESTIDKGISGQLSFEQRMGCGFGACMGCSCKTVSYTHLLFCRRHFSLS